MIGKKISECGPRSKEKKMCFISLLINCKIYNLFCFSLLVARLIFISICIDTFRILISYHESVFGEF